MSTAAAPVSLIARDVPKASSWLATQYWATFAVRHYVSAKLLQKYKAGLEQRLLRASRDYAEENSEFHPVPSVTPDALSIEDFQQDFVKGNRPVVIQGLAKDWEAVKLWSPEYLKEKYGDQIVPLRTSAGGVDKKSLEYEDTTVTEMIDGILAGRPIAGSNMEDLFNRNPELREQLDIDVLRRYFCTRRMVGVGSTQMFVSSPKSVTGFHCAGGDNMFVNVFGSKRWVFVSPRHSIWMYPDIRKDMMYCSSLVDWRKSYDELAEEGHQLFECIPKYTVDLQPGDVLFSPQWWWHGVTNYDVTIGVATRTKNSALRGHSVWGAMGFLSPAMWGNVLSVMRTGWGSDKTGARTIFEKKSKEESREPA